MKIDIYLRHTTTSETSVYHDPLDYGESEDELNHIDYMYGEGNYSCDCNRLLFLHDWDIDDSKVKCGSGLIAIDKIINRDTGKVLFADL